MITTNQLRDKARRLWPKLLEAHASGESLFPCDIPLAPPSGRYLQNRYPEVARWVKDIESYAKEHKLHLKHKGVSLKQQGIQQLPDKVSFDSREEFLAFLHERQRFAAFEQNLYLTQNKLPQLMPWLRDNVRLVEKNERVWAHLLKAVRYFVDNPNPQKYLRQLDISIIDRKFIESNANILGQLLDFVLPAEAINQQAEGSGLTGFCRRYGLRYEQPMIRFRWLDQSLAKQTGGLRDLALQLDDFIQLKPSIQRVFIIENQLNSLCFPDIDDSLLIFGLDAQVELLSQVDWLQDVEVYYWGDIDSHGFQQLQHTRQALPNTQSFLMDEATLMASQVYWGKEDKNKRFSGELELLTDTEQGLYQALLQDQHRPLLKLEQERVPFSWVEKYLQKTMTS